MRRRRASDRGRAGANWAGGLACGAVLAFSPGTVLFAATMLAPSLLARVLDREPGRRTTRAVLLAGLASSLAPFLRLWAEMPPSLSRALDLLAMPRTLAVAWLAAGSAWLGGEFAGLCAWWWLARGDAAGLSRLDAEIAALQAEWEP